MNKFKILKGFTLIELIVVIAVLGILSAIVIVAVNPLEQLGRGRDATRKTSVSQLGRAMQNYIATTSTVTYGPNSTTWLMPLTTSGDIKVIPSSPVYSLNGTTTTCNTPTTFAQGGVGTGYCYNSNINDAVIFARLESSAEKNKCSGAPVAWYVWSSSNGGAGVYCQAAGTNPAPQSTPLTLIP